MRLCGWWWTGGGYVLKWRAIVAVCRVFVVMDILLSLRRGYFGLGSLMYRSILLLLMRHNVATTRILSTLTLLVMRIQFVILLVSLSDGYKVINFFFCPL